MDKPYDELILLVETWKRFKEEHPAGGLEGFKQWLTSDGKKEKEYTEGEKFIIQTAAGMHGEDEASNVANRAIIGSLLGRMTSFVRNYSKVPFQRLGLKSMDEFKILSMIQRMKEPSKSMLRQAALMEFTTINDMVKRFERKGWIEQLRNENDKRASRICLTPEGHAFLKLVYTALSEMQPKVTGDLSVEEQQQLMHLLMKLNHYHSDYYNNHFLKKHKLKE